MILKKTIKKLMICLSSEKKTNSLSFNYSIFYNNKNFLFNETKNYWNIF